MLFNNTTEDRKYVQFYGLLFFPAYFNRSRRPLQERLTKMLSNCCYIAIVGVWQADRIISRLLTVLTAYLLEGGFIVEAAMKITVCKVSF